MNIVQLPSQLHRHHGGSPDIARLQYEDFSHTKVRGPVDGTCHVPFYKDYVTMDLWISWDFDGGSGHNSL